VVNVTSPAPCVNHPTWLLGLNPEPLSSLSISSFPFLYLWGSWGNHEGNRKHVCGKEEPTMNRAVVKVLFAMLVAAAEIFIEVMKQSKKACK